MSTEIPTFTHTDAAEQWSNSEVRSPVFTVDVPNPAWEEWDKLGFPEDGNDRQEEPPRTVTKTYTMPAKPNAGLALRYLKEARKTSPDVAMSWLIEKAVGEEGYDALTDELAGYEGDSAAVLQQIVGRIQTVAMGGLTPPKG